MLIPSVDIMEGRTVQLIGGREKALEAGDPLEAARRFSIAGELAVVDLDAALGRGSNREIIERLCRLFPCRVGGGIRDLETAQRYLEAGALKIVLGTVAQPELLRQLPPERVIVALDAEGGEVVVEGWRRPTGRTVLERMRELRGLCGGFLVTFVEREGRLAGTSLERVPELVEAAGGASLTVAGGITTPEEIARLDRMGADAQVGMALYTGKLDLAEGLAAPLVSDRPDGLWATVVCDEEGRALGLAWSNLESLKKAVELRRGVYWSRKRGLWIKGENSGSWQELIRIEADCDRDALRFTVRQHGKGFCHRGTRTCWGDLPITPGTSVSAFAGGPAEYRDRCLLRRVEPAEVKREKKECLEPQALEVAKKIVEEVRREGEAALRRHAERLGDLAEGEALFIGKEKMQNALSELDRSERELLERTADRIRTFARAQRRAFADLEVPVPGGMAGHRLQPLESAGCYVPGGRYPLVSSLLMTALTAREAGVKYVAIASPRPSPVILAAAALVQADIMLAAGGAQAIAALAYGAGEVKPCQIVVGPGNSFVTAAKYLVSRHVRIDMLAGPSELLVLADETADPRLVAADLLAQAEHDPEARPMLVCFDAGLLDGVEKELARQLEGLPAAEVARRALENGFCCLAQDLAEAVEICRKVSPEHLSLAVSDAEKLAGQLSAYGALFVGEKSAEVFGDYGAGPNHVLPTGGIAAGRGGLSVLDFMAVRTWLRLDDPELLAGDAASLARIEGLEAHARSAELRLAPLRH